MAQSLPGMVRWQNRVALVTGASAGIGAAVCKSLVQNGMTVIGAARRVEKIEELGQECERLGYPGKLIAKQVDISKDDEIDQLFSWITANYKGVDVCVNNAGFSHKESLLEISGDQMREMLNVNVVGLVLCSAKSVKSMLARGVNDGHIFNINSMSGHRLTNMIHFYSATKFAVTALTEGFRRELVEKSRIRVTSISPGMVVTEFTATAFGAEEGKAIYEKRGNLMQVEDIVDALLFALAAPERAQVHDILIRPTGDVI